MTDETMPAPRWAPFCCGEATRSGPAVGLFAALLLCLLGACGGDERADAPTPSTARLFAEPPTFAPASPVRVLTPVPHAALPRTAAGVSLRMTSAEVEGALGKLSCVEKAAGYSLCTGSKDTGEDVRDLEVFVYQDRVLSLSYRAAAPDDAWNHFGSLVATYGEPVLKGLTEKDRKGRLHEIYGWKDEVTIYSVRFIWVEEAPKPRELTSLAITIWDREAYLKWEKDLRRVETRPPEPTPPAEAPGGPRTPERA